jgi:transcriptional regulator with XRE-family HTH domain
MSSRERNEAIRERFAVNLLRIRRDHGMTQETLATLAGIHRTEASLLERGKREPRLGTLVKLAAALEVSLDALLEGIDWEPSDRARGDTGGFRVASDQLRSP